MIATQTAIRWLLRKDWPAVLAIERESFPHPWSEDDWLRCLRGARCIALAAEDATGVVLGYVVFELEAKSLRLLNLAVRADWRRRGLGRALIEKLKARLSYQRRKRIDTEVWEWNVGAQLFLRAEGFRAIATLRDYYEDTADSAIAFRYRRATTSAAGGR